MFVLNSNEPTKINQPINVEWRNCDENGQQFFSWKQEKNFGRLIKQRTF